MSNRKRKLETLKQYFIAIIPPSPVYEEALALKNYFRDTYQSKASLNSPPHITLHMPFKWKEEKESALIDSLEKFMSNCEALQVKLVNFGAFPPRVIFISVEKSDMLSDLQRDLMRFCKRELQLFNSNYKDLPFHPHLTLAFRDLKKHNYTEAWREFSEREYQTQFTADTVALLKHTGKEWEVYHRFALLQPQTVTQ